MKLEKPLLAGALMNYWLVVEHSKYSLLCKPDYSVEGLLVFQFKLYFANILLVLDLYANVTVGILEF